jgi:hypothetical protein
MPPITDLLAQRTSARHATSASSDVPPAASRAPTVSDPELAAHLERTRQQFTALRQEIAAAFAQAQEHTARQFAAVRAHLDASLADARTRQPPATGNPGERGGS